MTCAKNGTLYFTENNKLHKLSTEGILETLAVNIGSKSTDFSMMGRNYDSYGIWTDAADNIYLAMIDSKNVIRIGNDGNAETIIHSDSLWTICSGVFDNKGNLWVLESSVANEVRARKITSRELAGGKPVSASAIQPHLLIIIFTGAAVILLFFAAKMILHKRKQKLLHFGI